jgi:hypothetical protein
MESIPFPLSRILIIRDFRLDAAGVCVVEAVAQDRSGRPRPECAVTQKRHARPSPAHQQMTMSSDEVRHTLVRSPDALQVDAFVADPGAAPLEAQLH